MKGIIFNSKSEADAMLAIIDANGGYPNETTKTIHATYIVKHPTLDQWAVMVVNGTALLVPENSNVVDLTEDWFPVYNP